MNAYILAGGKSSRMGSNKALLEIHGTPMCLYIAEKLLSAGVQKVFLITKTPLHIEIPQLIELCEDTHPLYGVHIALTHNHTSTCLISPCDVPFVSIHSYQNLLQLHPNTVATTSEKKHPLLGIFDCSSPERALHYAQEQRSVMSFVESFHTFGLPEAELQNINSPLDLEDPSCSQ